jgi:lipopolysaccharide heptosyltransferase II
MNLLEAGAIHRILVIKWSALGDVVIATALMEDIHQAFPNAEIDLNTMPNCLALFKDDPRFREVFAIDVRDASKRCRNTWTWLKKVRAARYDLVIDLQRSDRTRLLLTLLCLTGKGPKHRVGNLGGFPYTVQPALRDSTAHAFTMMRSVLESINVPARTEHPFFHLAPDQHDRVAALRAGLGLKDGTYVVLLPGSHAAGQLKRWGTARYAELARLLHVEYGVAKVVIVGGPDEVDVCAELACVGDFVVNLNGRLQLLDIAPLCKGARAIIGNDTGTAHFSAGAGRPLLVLCGPTDPRRVKPIGGTVVAVQSSLPCINCYSKKCRNPDYHACMKAITPEWVASHIPLIITGDFKAGQSYPNGLRSY